MNNILSKTFIFVMGAAAGSLITWKLVEAKYARISQEEIESVREMYSKRNSEKDNGEMVKSETEDDSDNAKYAKIIKLAGYDEDEENEEEEEEGWMIEPYVISPDEYDEEGYETVTFYYYDDGVLENSLTREVIKNVDELIGEDSLTHFGEYEDDSVFVRNDNLKTDFEILRVSERYGG